MSLQISQINHQSSPIMSNRMKLNSTQTKEAISFGLAIDLGAIAINAGIAGGLLSVFGITSAKMSKKSSYLLDALGFIKAKGASLNGIQGQELLKQEYTFAEKYLLEKHKKVLNPFGFLTQTFHAAPRNVYSFSKLQINNFTNHIKRVGFDNVANDLKDYLGYVQQMFEKEALAQKITKSS